MNFVDVLEVAFSTKDFNGIFISDLTINYRTLSILLTYI